MTRRIMTVAALLAACQSTTGEGETSGDVGGASAADTLVEEPSTPTTTDAGNTTSSSGDGSTGGTVGETGEEASNCFFIGPKKICVQRDDPAPSPNVSLMVGEVPPQDDLPAVSWLLLQGLLVPDQGSCGSCVAFATRNAMGAREIGEHGESTDFSGPHIWSVAGYGSESCEDGSNIGTVVDAQLLTKMFIVPTSTWPYDPWDPQDSLDAVPSPAQLAVNGVAHIASSAYVDPGSIDDIRNSIAYGWPVILAVPVYENSGFTDNSGDVDSPGLFDEYIGGHAITVVGYSDLDGTFGFVNSWGTSWGSQGYGSLTYEFVAEYSKGGRAISGLSYHTCEDCGYCGDGMCDADENQGTCCADCGCSGGKLCGETCTCPAGQNDCGGNCVDLDADANNCGGCYNDCSPGEVCADGDCVLDCGGLDQCGDVCVNLATSEQHCGTCGNACEGTDQCVGGNCTCVPTVPSTEVCDGVDNDCDGLVDEDPACVVCVPIGDLNLFPLSITQDDAEFDGSGPKTTVTVTASRTPTSITVEGCVVMEETEPDWSVGEKCSVQVVNYPNTGFSDDTYFKVIYVDTDHAWDDAIAESYSLNPAPFVKSVQCIGDTSGADICNSAPPSCSTCSIDLGCINVRVPPK